MNTLTRVGLTVSVLSLCLAASAANNSCIECHSNEDFYARFPKLYNYYQDWITSPHALNGVTCDDCHGGNAEGATARSAHEGMLPVSDKNSTLYFSRQPRTCGVCHNEKRVEFEQSKHFRALQDAETAAPTCTTCHPAMNKRPSYQVIVLDACTTCHHAGNRQHLPEVLDEAENLLRHINVAQGMIGWARLHFSSHDWPGNSREEMQAIEQRYSNIVDRVHRFDLQESDGEALQLLTELRTIFDAERGSSGARSSPGPQ